MKWINLALNESRKENPPPKKNSKISCFEELDLLSGKLEASPELWNPSQKSTKKYQAFFHTKFPYTNFFNIKRLEAGSLKRNTALEHSTRVVQEGGRRCKKSTLNDLVHLTPLRIPSMNPP
jgi:hypothetical protein